MQLQKSKRPPKPHTLKLCPLRKQNRTAAHAIAYRRTPGCTSSGPYCSWLLRSQQLNKQRRTLRYKPSIGAWNCTRRSTRGERMATINLLLVHKLFQYQVNVSPTITFGQLKVLSPCPIISVATRLSPSFSEALLPMRRSCLQRKRTSHLSS